MAFTVVSLGRVMKAGYLVKFNDPSCNIKRKSNGIVIGRIPVSSNMLFKVKHALVANAVGIPKDIHTLH